MALDQRQRAPATVATTVLLMAGLVAFLLIGPTQAQSGLSLSDFDRTGLEVEALALFEAGDAGTEPALYAASGSRWTASGSLLEGEIGIAPDDEAIVRIMSVDSGSSVLRFNDAGDLTLRDYFGNGGGGNDLTVWVQTSGATASFPASDIGSAGGNYVNFNLPTGADAVVAGIDAGDRFILALTRPAPTPEPTPTPTPTPTHTPTPTPTPTPTQTPTPTPPSAPTGLTVPSVSHDSVTLSWDDPGDGSITGYQVLRRSRDRDTYKDNQGAAEFVAVTEDTGSPATTYTDTSVTPRTRYVYRVKAINGGGLSPRSTYLNVETTTSRPHLHLPRRPRPP